MLKLTIRCRLFPDRFFLDRIVLVGVTVDLSTRIKTSKLEWKHSKNDATETKPHAVKHQMGVQILSFGLGMFLLAYI